MTRNGAARNGTGFRRFANRAAQLMGSPMAFAAAVLVIVLWGASGPLFAFSETWQLVVNTGTTIVTFLMIFLVQNTQNRDSLAIQLKLDELIRGTEGPRTTLVDLENLDDEDLRRLQAEFEEIAGDTIEALDDVAESAGEVGEIAGAVQEAAGAAHETARRSARRSAG